MGLRVQQPEPPKGVAAIMSPLPSSRSLATPLEWVGAAFQPWTLAASQSVNSSVLVAPVRSSPGMPQYDTAVLGI